MVLADSECFRFRGIEGKRIPQAVTLKDARDLVHARIDGGKLIECQFQGAAFHHGLIQSEMLCYFDFVGLFHGVLIGEGSPCWPRPETGTL